MPLGCYGWMSQNFLRINKSKTEVIVFTPSDIHCTSNVNLGVPALYVKPHVENLDMVLDSALKLDRQVNQVLSQSLSFIYKLERVIHGFITTRLDYCNSIWGLVNRP